MADKPPDVSGFVIPNTADDPWGLGSNKALPSVASFLGLPPTATLTDAMVAFAHAPVSTQAQVTQLMYRAGLYPSNYVPTPGAPLKPNDITAFRDAALTSARVGADLSTYLTQSADLTQQTGVQRAGKVGGANVYTTSPTDPNQLGQLADRIASTVLGHGLTPAKRAQVISVIAAHQNAQDAMKNAANETASRQQYAAANAAQDTGTDTYIPPTTISTPTIDPAADAEAQIRADNPMDAATHRGLHVGNLLMNALMSSPGNAPTGSEAAP